ncbi:MAG: hypothetical protein N2C12_17875, partial [Planctomycetales bacterium]
PGYRMTDPAADIAAYLLGADWKPEADGAEPLSKDQQALLSTISLEYLQTSFSKSRSLKYLKKGIPERLRSSLKGAEVELLVPDKPGTASKDSELGSEVLLTYVGRRTISKYGCAGCHDIPGLETAKPIGTTLADWGRKEPSKLAFEHIVHHVEHKEHPGEKNNEDETGAHNHPKTSNQLDPYFKASLVHHQREGFLRQKLEEPRSYDYKKVETKKYNDRLRMPQFQWAAGVVEDDQHDKRKRYEIEAIMTFVLGLVAEPPASQYVYQPDPRRKAIIEGKKVAEKFNCVGCHVLEMGRWDITYRPGTFEQPASPFQPDSSPAVFPFLKPEFTPEEIYPSKHVDWRQMLHGTLRGMEKVTTDGDQVQLVWDAEDEQFIPVEEYRDAYDEDPPASADTAYSVQLWKPTYLDGHPYLVHDNLPDIPKTMVNNHYPPEGGDFARLLLPLAVNYVRSLGTEADGTAAKAWVPPPLVGQGRKTRPEWLTDFLLQPYRIRPGVLLRMPKFNMSRSEATQLVQYFAAHDNPTYPEQFEAVRDQVVLEAAEQRYEQRLEKAGLSGTRFGDALKIVINKAGCVSCHSVNDMTRDGGQFANGPNLGDVYRRLQPEYVKRWVAQPNWKLPYTKMQVLFPYRPQAPPSFGGFELFELDDQGKPKLDAAGKPIPIELYHGTSKEQLQAVVDLLTNFGLYMESQTSIQNRAVEVDKELGLELKAEQLPNDSTTNN